MEGNRASGSGGGLYLQDCAALLSGVTVADNTIHNGSGAGLQLLRSPTTLSNASVTGNQCTGPCNGAGLQLFEADAQLTNVLVADNYTPTGVGGGIDAYYGAPMLENVLVAGNRAEHVGGVNTWHNDGMTLTNVSIVGNSSWWEGAGLYVWYTQVQLTNVDFTLNVCDSCPGNSPGPGGLYSAGGSPTLSHCNAYQNYPENYGGLADPTGADGNLSESANYQGLSDPDPLNWSLHLGAASLLVDAGDPSILDPDGSPSDIGAFGGPGAAQWDLDRDGYPGWWLPGVYDPATSPGMDCDDLDPAVYPGNGC